MPTRIATYGWSYGGYMTLKMLEANPGVYAGGVVGRAGDQLGAVRHPLYRAVSWAIPTSDAEAYAASDALGDATKISDPLLLIHGMSDDNVVLREFDRVRGEDAGGRPRRSR